jgi:hypothetical protein
MSDVIDWSKAPEGLPPVGSIVKLRGVTTISEDDFDIDEHCIIDMWRNGDELEVLAHRSIHGLDAIVVFNKRAMQASAIMKDFYEPIRTPEQIAADERQATIKDMLDVSLGRMDICCAAYLYDSGYRRKP